MKKAIVILCSLLAAFPLMAETIKDIRIVNQAGESYDISSVTAFTSFSVGEQVPDRETILSSIAVDVNRMRESGRFTYVDARMDVEEDGVVLVYTVTSRNKLRRITIDGAKKMRNRKVRQKSELTIGQFADDATFAQAAAKIREAYRDFWYPEAKITWQTSIVEELGTVDVTFQVDEGQKLGIKRIEFDGRNNIEDKNLGQRILSALLPSLLEKKKADVVSAKTLRGQMQQKQ
jgi:outer membrane protein insertion porin family